MFENGFALGRLRSDLDQLFGSYFGDPDRWVRRERGGSPAINLWEDETSFHAEAEVPGLRMEDIELYVVGNELVLKGSRRADERGGAAYHRQERGAGHFSRVLRLPSEVDPGKVQATLKDGVLTVTLPKAEAARPRRIDVKYAVHN